MHSISADRPHRLGDYCIVLYLHNNTTHRMKVRTNKSPRLNPPARSVRWLPLPGRRSACSLAYWLPATQCVSPDPASLSRYGAVNGGMVLMLDDQRDERADEAP